MSLSQQRSWACSLAVWVDFPLQLSSSFPPSKSLASNGSTGGWLCTKHGETAIISLDITHGAQFLRLETAGGKVLFSGQLSPSCFTFALLPHGDRGDVRQTPGWMTTAGSLYQLAVSVLRSNENRPAAYTFLCHFRLSGHAVECATFLNSILKGTPCPAPQPTTTMTGGGSMTPAEELFIQTVAEDPLSAGICWWGDEFTGLISDMEKLN